MSKNKLNIKKSKKSADVEVKKKKKSAEVEAPVKKKKKVAVEDTKPSKKSKGDKVKSGKVEKAGKKDKKKGKGEKPAKKAKKIIANEAKPVKTKLNRGQTLAAIIEAADLQEIFGKKFEISERQEKKVVQAVLAAQESLILGSIHKNGIGQFTLGNLLKIVTKKVDAKPRRKGINPFTKEEQWFEAKPATVRVKARPMKRLKDAAL